MRSRSSYRLSAVSSPQDISPQRHRDTEENLEDELGGQNRAPRLPVILRSQSWRRAQRNTLAVPPTRRGLVGSEGLPGIVPELHHRDTAPLRPKPSGISFQRRAFAVGLAGYSGTASAESSRLAKIRKLGTTETQGRTRVFLPSLPSLCGLSVPGQDATAAILTRVFVLLCVSVPLWLNVSRPEARYAQ
jgi:hypothetical protein